MSNDQKLWRYMDLTKFLELIIHQRLYLNRSDNFEDKHEGELDSKSQKWLKSNIFNSALSPPIKNNPEKSRYFISCWHGNDYESAAMWKLYGVINDAIAITTTVSSLKKILPEQVNIHQVEYFDDKQGFDLEDYGLTQEKLFTRKRLSFEHEKEYRAIYISEKNYDIHAIPEASFVGENINPIGVNFQINVSQLIESVIISPYASPLVKPIIEDILKNYKLEKIQVKNSDLYRL